MQQQQQQQPAAAAPQQPQPAAQSKAKMVLPRVQIGCLPSGEQKKLEACVAGRLNLVVNPLKGMGPHLAEGAAANAMDYLLSSARQLARHANLPGSSMRTLSIVHVAPSSCIAAAPWDRLHMLVPKLTPYDAYRAQSLPARSVDYEEVRAGRTGWLGGKHRGYCSHKFEECTCIAARIADGTLTAPVIVVMHDVFDITLDSIGHLLAANPDVAAVIRGAKLYDPRYTKSLVQHDFHSNTSQMVVAGTGTYVHPGLWPFWQSGLIETPTGMIYAEQQEIWSDFDRGITAYSAAPVSHGFGKQPDHEFVSMAAPGTFEDAGVDYGLVAGYFAVCVTSQLTKRWCIFDVEVMAELDHFCGSISIEHAGAFYVRNQFEHRLRSVKNFGRSMTHAEIEALFAYAIQRLPQLSIAQDDNTVHAVGMHTMSPTLMESLTARMTEVTSIASGWWRGVTLTLMPWQYSRGDRLRGRSAPFGWHQICLWIAVFAAFQACFFATFNGFSGASWAAPLVGAVLTWFTGFNTDLVFGAPECNLWICAPPDLAEGSLGYYARALVAGGGIWVEEYVRRLLGARFGWIVAFLVSVLLDVFVQGPLVETFATIALVQGALTLLASSRNSRLVVVAHSFINVFPALFSVLAVVVALLPSANAEVRVAKYDTTMHLWDGAEPFWCPYDGVLRPLQCTQIESICSEDLSPFEVDMDRTFDMCFPHRCRPSVGTKLVSATPTSVPVYWRACDHNARDAARGRSLARAPFAGLDTCPAWTDFLESPPGQALGERVYTTRLSARPPYIDYCNHFDGPKAELLRQAEQNLAQGARVFTSFREHPKTDEKSYFGNPQQEMMSPIVKRRIPRAIIAPDTGVKAIFGSRHWAYDQIRQAAEKVRIAVGGDWVVAKFTGPVDVLGSYYQRSMDSAQAVAARINKELQAGMRVIWVNTDISKMDNSHLKGTSQFTRLVHAMAGILPPSVFEPEERDGVTVYFPQSYFAGVWAKARQAFRDMGAYPRTAYEHVQVTLRRIAKSNMFPTVKTANGSIRFKMDYKMSSGRNDTSEATTEIVSAVLVVINHRLIYNSIANFTSRAWDLAWEYSRDLFGLVAGDDSNCASVANMSLSECDKVVYDTFAMFGLKCTGGCIEATLPPEVEMCSTRPYPTKGGIVAGQKLGRFFAGVGCVPNRVPDKYVVEHMRAVVQGYLAVLNHVQPARVFLKRVASLLGDGPAIDKWLGRRFVSAPTCPIEADDIAVRAFVCQVYKCEPWLYDDLIRWLARWQLQHWLNHPLIEQFVAADCV